MLSDIKAKKYAKGGRVFPLKRAKGFEYWGVDGDTGTWEVRYDAEKKEYSCNCPSIRTKTDCSHIKSVMIVKSDKSGDEKSGRGRL